MNRKALGKMCAGGETVLSTKEKWRLIISSVDSPEKKKTIMKCILVLCPDEKRLLTSKDEQGILAM